MTVTEREEWLSRVMEEYRTCLMRMSYLYLGDFALAEDAVQETFIKAYYHLDSFRGESSEKTWLIRIAINMATSTTAAISDMPRSDSPNLQRMETMLCKAADLEREIVADQVAIDTAKEEIMAAVFDIEDYREQQVLYHRYVECQAWSAVAEACGCHIRTAHRFHDRGVEHMAEKLSHSGHPKNT